MITRQDVRRVLEALDERVLMEILLNPVEVLHETWDYRHYTTFRRFAREGDWEGLARTLKECPETAVVDTMLTLIKDASPRLYAIVVTERG